MRFLLLFWLFQPVLTPDTPLTVTLTAGAGSVDIAYRGAADEVVTISAYSRAAEPIDVTLEILRDGQRVAYNDDHQGAVEGLNAQDAVVSDLVLEGSGDYVIRVHTFSGAQSGEVEVRAQPRALIAPCQQQSRIVQLARHTPYTCLVDAQAGQRVHLTARDISGTLDPVLSLIGPDESVLARNDDHASADLTLNVLDAKLESIAITENGLYTVRVSDFSGAMGTLELRVEIES